MKLKAAQFINTFLLFLVAGVFWGTWFSLARSMRSITPGTFLEVGKIMIRNLFAAALLAALCAGLITAGLQHFRVTPLILHAETFEGAGGHSHGEEAHSHAAGTPEHSHDAGKGENHRNRQAELLLNRHREMQREELDGMGVYLCRG